MAFPIVNAAKTVPMPRPFKLPRKKNVIPAVMARQITSKEILMIEYLMRMI